MFVCNCNGITRRQVDAAKRDGVDNWADVYAYYDCTPCCGKCIPEMCEQLNDDPSGESAGLFSPALQGA